MASLPRKECFVEVPGGKVWCLVVGENDKIPLIVLHGGPGYPHDYLEPLQLLGSFRTVIFYDQLGCGKSDRPAEQSLWRIPRFVEELRIVCERFAPGGAHVLGHSWGTILALEFALKMPQLLKSAIFASPCISIPRWEADSHLLRRKLPQALQFVLHQCEKEGDFQSTEYQLATLEYYKRFVYGMAELPEYVGKANEGFSPEVYHKMWGPNEFFVQGTLAHYDNREGLAKLSVPSLFTCGREDEATPEATRWYQELTPHAQLAVFENSAHMPHITEAAAYRSLLDEFMNRVERGEGDGVQYA